MLSKAKIKYIRSLQLKKFRQKYNSYIAEGPKIVDELLNSESLIHTILATKSWFENNSGKLTTNHCEQIEISEKELGKISLLTTPQEVIAIVGIKEFDESYPSKGLHIALDSISDPGNMGTIIRTADWFGVDRIYCSPDSVDTYNPKVVQASMGSVSRVQLIYKDLITVLRNVELRCYAATLDGEKLRRSTVKEDALIVIGNESRGISKDVVSLCSASLSIPKFGTADSLNAAMACGIILYAFRVNPG